MLDSTLAWKVTMDSAMAAGSTGVLYCPTLPGLSPRLVKARMLVGSVSTEPVTAAPLPLMLMPCSIRSITQRWDQLASSTHLPHAVHRIAVSSAAWTSSDKA